MIRCDAKPRVRLRNAFVECGSGHTRAPILAAVFLFIVFPGAMTATAQDENVRGEDVAQQNAGLVIEPAELPTTYPKGPYQVVFHAQGNYVPTLHWSVESGALPPGITLEDNGVLHGEAQRAGEFQFLVSVGDSGKPKQGAQKTFTLKVVEALAVAWKVPAHVNVNRIEGSVEVSNATPEDMDLTFDVKAVAGNGRATEIGYQHFPLGKGTIGMVLPFGDTLPNGGYVVYVTVVGEIVPRNVIYRQLMQTPAALQVNVGP
jgi:hypothetical protein